MLKAVVITLGVVIGAAAVAPQALTSLVGKPAEPSRALAVSPQKTSLDASGAVTLRAGADGHFRTDAVISGRRVPMLVDTGATVIALSYEQGLDLGLVNASDRFDVGVATANGTVGAKRVVLNEVRVGPISVPGVQALVLTRGAMDGNLLGMSFLGRLRRMEATRDRLTLER